MFKKFFVSVIAFTILTVQANAATHNNLKAAFDDLNYALTVDWDQSDKAFYNAKMDNFAASIKEMQAEGLTNQELVDFTLSQVKDQKLAQDLKTAFTMVVINKMSPTEAHAYITDVMSKSYSSGASWAGEVVLGAIGLVIFVALAAVVIGSAKIEDGCYKVRSCEQSCIGNSCIEDCDYRCL